MLCSVDLLHVLGLLRFALERRRSGPSAMDVVVNLTIKGAKRAKSAPMGAGDKRGASRGAQASRQNVA